MRPTLILNKETRHTTFRDKTVRLSPNEFQILSFLAINPGRYIPSCDIAVNALGWPADLQTAVVRVTVMRIRRKLDDIGIEGKALLQSKKGTGYKLNPAYCRITIID